MMTLVLFYLVLPCIFAYVPVFNRWTSTLITVVEFYCPCATGMIRSCDVLVLGATGKSKLQMLTVGSTTRNILRDAPCSVIVVR
jgi:nucleotide-binding universal stress UspA family protein